MCDSEYRLIIEASANRFGSDFDYTLIIEFERLSINDLKSTLQYLYHSSSECYGDIEFLADEVIRRLHQCRYSIRDRQNKDLNQLIISTFETLKSISHFMEFPSERIQIIYDNYHKYMYSVESPVASPVVSPMTEEVKYPKIMKKAKNHQSTPKEKTNSFVKLPKIMKKTKN